MPQVVYAYGCGAVEYSGSENAIMGRDLSAARAGEITDFRDCHAVTRNAAGFGMGTILALNAMAGAGTSNPAVVETVMRAENTLPLAILRALKPSTEAAFGDRVKQIGEPFFAEVLELWEGQPPAREPVRYAVRGKSAGAPGGP